VRESSAGASVASSVAGDTFRAAASSFDFRSISPKSDATYEHRAQLKAQVTIAGEYFAINHEGDAVVLSHPRWSLLGVGEDIGSALTDLITEARDVRDAMRGLPDPTLSAEALRLKSYLNDVFA
jgi:hypothetical protein